MMNMLCSVLYLFGKQNYGRLMIVHNNRKVGTLLKLKNRCRHKHNFMSVLHTLKQTTIVVN